MWCRNIQHQIRWEIPCLKFFGMELLIVIQKLMDAAQLRAQGIEFFSTMTDWMGRSILRSMICLGSITLGAEKISQLDIDLRKLL